MTDTLSVSTNLQHQVGNFPQNFSYMGVTGNSNLNGSIFNPMNSSNSYANDFMMSGFDFDSLCFDSQSQSIFQVKPQQNNNPVQSANLPTLLPTQQNFTSGNRPQQITTPQNNQVIDNANLSELDNYLVRRENNQQKPENKNTGKLLGATMGFLAPVGEQMISGLKNSKSLLKSLNFKQLAVTCPIIAIAGFGIGALVDNIVNAIKENKNQQQQTQISGQNNPQMNLQAQQPLTPQTIV